MPNRSARFFNFSSISLDTGPLEAGGAAEASPPNLAWRAFSFSATSAFLRESEATAPKRSARFFRVSRSAAGAPPSLADAAEGEVAVMPKRSALKTQHVYCP